MLNFDYYFVDVGENSCLIRKRNFMISIFEALVERNGFELRIAKEFIVHKFKKNVPISNVKDFKIVCVNKTNKLSLKAEVVDMTTDLNINPVAETKKHITFIMQPNQRLDIECQVIQNETEYRALMYADIKGAV